MSLIPWLESFWGNKNGISLVHVGSYMQDKNLKRYFGDLAGAFQEMPAGSGSHD